MNGIYEVRFIVDNVEADSTKVSNSALAGGAAGAIVSSGATGGSGTFSGAQYYKDQQKKMNESQRNILGRYPARDTRFFSNTQQRLGLRKLGGNFPFTKDEKERSLKTRVKGTLSARGSMVANANIPYGAIAKGSFAIGAFAANEYVDNLTYGSNLAGAEHKSASVSRRWGALTDLGGIGLAAYINPAAGAAMVAYKAYSMAKEAKRFGMELAIKNNEAVYDAQRLVKNTTGRSREE